VGTGDKDPLALIGVLGELGRLELDLLVRDLGAVEAVALLRALGQELERILDEAAQARGDIRGVLAGLEERLGRSWPGPEAVEPLALLAEERRILAELDLASRPAIELRAEVVRRSTSRLPQQESR
jgi:hypothetical protein